MAVIVGGVATPVTSYCIMAIDFCKAMQKGMKIIKKFRNDPNMNRSDIEGIDFKFSVETYFYKSLMI